MAAERERVGGRQGDAGVLKQRLGDAFGLGEQRLEQVLVVDLRVAALRGVGQRGFECLLELFGESFWCHMAATDVGEAPAV